MAKDILSSSHLLINLTGKVFGRLTVMSLDDPIRKGKRVRTIWLCQCSCGKTKPVSAMNLKNGKAKSCGCLRRETVRDRSQTHGESGENSLTTEYDAWHSMKRRCAGSTPAYKKNYLDKGITIHAPWVEDFTVFLAAVGRRPSPKHSLDRFPNPNGNYEPGNVRWATAKEQARNKTNNRHLTFNGETHIACEWAEILGINIKCFTERLRRWGECDRLFAVAKRSYRKGNEQ